MKLLATDLDRTLLPNGLAPYDESMSLLGRLIDDHDISVAYVTARRVQSVLHTVMSDFAPPPASYIIGAVGAEIFISNSGGFFQEVSSWNTHVHLNAPQWQRREIERAVTERFPFLTLQPEKEQTLFKISYFLYDLSRFVQIEEELQQVLKDIFGSSAFATCSLDLNAELAYVDITPPVVSKISALQFLMNQLHLKREQVLFAGDSGNDLSVFLSSLDSVVVANAEEAIKRRVKKEKLEGELYLAEGVQGLNGNYCSGVIEGLLKKGWVSSQKLSEALRASYPDGLLAK